VNPQSDVIFSLDAPFRDSIEIHRLRFGDPTTGPHIAIVAGLHGNEVGGVCAVNQLVSQLKTATIEGCIDVYPVINRMGLDETSKMNPLDHRDINRWFPGHPEGSASERIANAVFEALKPCDWVVSVHTGAEHVCDLVQVRCLETERTLCSKLGAPLVWIQPELDGLVSLLGQCRQRGQKVLYVTGGSGNSVHQDTIDLMQSLLHQFLAATNVVKDILKLPDTALTFEGKMTEIRGQQGGFFLPRVLAGQKVAAGTLLGTIQHVVGGEILEAVEAPCDSMITSVRVNPIVYPHELIVRLIPF
jgi:hypothetical protein